MFIILLVWLGEPVTSSCISEISKQSNKTIDSMTEPYKILLKNNEKVSVISFPLISYF